MTSDTTTPPVVSSRAKKPGVGVIAGACIAVIAILTVVILGFSTSQGAPQIDFPLDLAEFDPDSPADVADLASVLQGLYEWEDGEDEYYFSASEEMKSAWGEGESDSPSWEFRLSGYAAKDESDGNTVCYLSSEDVASGGFTISEVDVSCILHNESLSYEEVAGCVAQVFEYDKIVLWDGSSGSGSDGLAIKGDTLARICGLGSDSLRLYGLGIAVVYKADTDELDTFDYYFSSDAYAEEHPEVYRMSRES